MDKRNTQTLFSSLLNLLLTSLCVCAGGTCMWMCVYICLYKAMRRTDKDFGNLPLVFPSHLLETGHLTGQWTPVSGPQCWLYKHRHRTQVCMPPQQIPCSLAISQLQYQWFKQWLLKISNKYHTSQRILKYYFKMSVSFISLLYSAS